MGTPRILGIPTQSGGQSISVHVHPRGVAWRRLGNLQLDDNVCVLDRAKRYPNTKMTFSEAATRAADVTPLRHRSFPDLMMDWLDIVNNPTSFLKAITFTTG
eukprot:Blabericola_migrator_1__11478@NODE_684_length_6884_cov_72_451372_g497_i0_p10_GENE_NODE_684_length_6884_cov_72_451372_g497_i0NODE_684_length_6884_cov_72_451372_g497_i0_p10_ORF_typecomplete_len102_score8_90_NODE_684_length_6884_cov_72_451372_g497_i046334938